MAITTHPSILNNLLEWNGSHLGKFSRDVITYHWKLENINYYGITPSIENSKFPVGIIYCCGYRVKDNFACIVEDIKSIFGIDRRGLHRINIDEREYIIYYVPISIKGEIIWETPLNRLDGKHKLRETPNFKRKVQRLIAFCDILGLTHTGEPAIIIRPSGDDSYIPINSNNFSLTKSDFSILSKVIFSKWFGEKTLISDVVKEMINQDIKSLDSITEICAIIRNKIDSIIKNYDINYSWYSCFIIDRMSRHLLNNVITHSM